MSDGNNAAFQAIVHGRVQGVGFRYYARDTARRLGITGWVKNRGDGTVEVYAEGPPDNLARFEAWLREGPPAARVLDVEVRRPAAIDAYPRFTVEFS